MNTIADVPDDLRLTLLPDVMVVQDLSPRLRMSDDTVRGHLRAGRLPGRKIGRRWIIERTALLEALSPANGPAPFRLVEGDEGGDA